MGIPTGGDENRKAEILAKSRKSQRDEGFEYAETQGTKIGVVVYAIVACILLIFSIPGRMDIVHTVAALSFAWVVGGTYSHYRFTKKKTFLICAIGSALATVANAIMVILPAFR